MLVLVEFYSLMLYALETYDLIDHMGTIFIRKKRVGRGCERESLDGDNDN